MAGPAHSSTVKVQGSTTAFTNEPTTKLTANTVYQITDTAKRILNPTVAITVEVDADGGGGGGYVVAGATTYTVDYLFGKITFDADQGVDALVRVSGSYYPVVTIAEVREFSIAASRTMLDATTFDSAGVRSKLAGLKDLSGSLVTLKTVFHDNDPGAGASKLGDAFDSNAQFLLEIRPNGSGDYFRAWVALESHEHKGAIDGLLETSLSFVGAAQQGLGQSEGAAFGWGS